MRIKLDISYEDLQYIRNIVTKKINEFKSEYINVDYEKQNKILDEIDRLENIKHNLD